MAAARLNPIKLKLPDTYHGQRDSMIIDSWIFQVDKYVGFYHLTENDQLGLVQTLLRGQAGIWWRDVEKKAARPADAIPPRIPAPATWEQFKTALKGEFMP